MNYIPSMQIQCTGCLHPLLRAQNVSGTRYSKVTRALVRVNALPRLHCVLAQYNTIDDKSRLSIRSSSKVIKII